VCLGRTHAVGGVTLGLAAADLTGGVSLVQALVGAVLAGGAALLNDLDTPSSTVSHALGRFTQRVASGVQRLSRAAFHLTATPADHRYASPTHRALTHTLIFALVVSGAAYEAARLAPLGSGVVTLVVAMPALRLVDRRLRGVSLLLAALGVTALVTAAGPSALTVGVAVGVGLLSHDLLDGCTTMGVPLLWPLKLRGMRWRRLGLPRFLRFHTGGPVEPWVLGLLVVLAVGLTPPVLSWLEVVAPQIINLAVYNWG
jgi:membrane-bound metal-dependent hydrolase YbcI (DUF457 family)